MHLIARKLLITVSDSYWIKTKIISSTSSKYPSVDSESSIIEMVVHDSAHQISANRIKHKSLCGIFPFILFYLASEQILPVPWLSLLQHSSELDYALWKPKFLFFPFFVTLMCVRLHTVRRGPWAKKKSRKKYYNIF